MQAATLGDINGDGVLEVVFATASGAVHALSGISGRDVAPFPFRTRGRITAPVLLTRLRDAGRALHAVVQSYDGHLYAIDGITGMAALCNCCSTGVAVISTAHSVCSGLQSLQLLLCPVRGIEGTRENWPLAELVAYYLCIETD